MIDRISPIFHEESKYLDLRHLAAHDESLNGIPVGSRIMAQVHGLRDVLVSILKDTVEVQITKPHGGEEARTLPKKVFLGLPKERRSINMKLQKPAVESGCFEVERHLSESRANTINMAVHMAAHNILELDEPDNDDQKTVVPNPFRTTDTREIGETLAIVDDHRNSGLHFGKGWHSHLQAPDDIKSVFKPGELSHDDDGGLRVDKHKLASVDHQVYRQDVIDAVDQLFANSRPSGEEDFPIS